FRYATCLDFFLLILGSLCSVITGGGFPLLSVIFGGMTNSFMAAQVSNFSTRSSTNDFAKNFSDDDDHQQQERNGSQMMNSSGSLQPISLEEFHANLIQYSLQYTYLGLAIMVCAYLQFACWSVCCERQVYRLRKEFFKSILRQEISWFDEHQSGELTTKLSEYCSESDHFSDLERIKEGIGDKFGLLLQYIFQIVAGFVVAFVYSWKLSLVMLAMTPLMALSAGFISKMIAESTKKEQSIYAAAGAIAEEALSCIRTVVAFNGQKQEISRYEDELKKGRKTGILKSVYTAVGFASAFFLMFASYALAFWYGSVLISNGEIDRGTVFVVLFSIMTGSFGLGSAAPLIGVVSVAVGASSSILEIIYNKPKIDAYSSAGKRLPDPKGALKFQNVKFSYPTRAGVVVLNDVSFDVETGENVAIVGPSGCGKSTIINLLLRYYEKHDGKITVDGRNIEDLNVRWLRNLIGVVSQEPILFDLTLEENIRFGKMDADFEQIVQAAKMANAHSFIAQLPDGYKTVVGERGAQLSGGQKQRIAIARALLRDPKILLLDEATSALDSESESLVQEALDKAQKGRTTIVIAHRLSTIKNADKIIVLDQGSVVESGNHVELMAKKGLYFDLVTVQMLNEVEPSTSNAYQDQSNDFDTGEVFYLTAQKSSAAVSPSNSSPKESLIRRKSSSMVSYSRTRSVSIDSFETTTARSLERRTTTNLLAKGADTETKRLKEELESYCFGVSGESLTMRLRLGVFRNLLRQSVSYFDDPAHSTGRICTRLSTDAPNIKAAVDFRLSTVLASFVSMFAGIVIAFVYGWKLAFLLLALVPFIGFSGYLNMKLRHSSQMSDSKLLEKAGK
uniref:Multidrug resistance protein 1 n=1 Tax=Romanomermis culicivorax TaxID=13658 RepID=A0A915IPL2_ROMCU